VALIAAVAPPPALGRTPTAMIKQFKAVGHKEAETPQLPFGMLRWNFGRIFYLYGASCSRPALLQVTAQSKESGWSRSSARTRSRL
jgi:hypothetical protein